MTAATTAAPRAAEPVPDLGGSLLDRADLLYCLARAFLPPPEGWSVCDWAQPLAEDLAELGASTGLPTQGVLDALDAECARWAAAARLADGAADAWLVEYTRLFLVPPVRVPLNTGLYLEGSIGGAAAQMMRSCYAAAGTAPSDAFHDLPDHVAMQLEFVARLLERGARGDADGAAMADEFCREFVHGWAGPLQQACVVAAGQQPAARVYAALAGLLCAAVAEPGLARA
jgi:TorA maturation chaperone TorD